MFGAIADWRQTNVWSPKFKQFVHSEWQETHIIDLDKTAPLLRAALELTESSHIDPWPSLT